MEAKDINGLTLSVGDRVAFSDAGRMGSVHTGVIQVIFPDEDGWLPSRLHIRDDRSHRMNYRWDSAVLCINGLTVPN